MASPAVVGTPTETAITTASTSHTVNLPSGASGNLLLAVMSKGSAGTTPSVNALAGWNELLDEAIVLGLYIAWRRADGTEGATTTFTLSSSTRGAWIVYEISGDSTATAPQVGTTATGSGTTPNPPSVSVTGGSKDILTIACFGRDGEEADGDTWVTAAPAGFGSLLQKACGTAGTNLAGMVATAHLASTTATSDPGTFTCATGGWRAQTIVVHPVPPTSTAVAEVSLDAGAEPQTRTAHSIKVRARTTAGAGTLRAALYEGATNRSGDLESGALTTSLADYTLSIPDASAANITDYSNLSIRFWGYAAGAGSIVFEVDQLWLETPIAFLVKTGFGKAGADGHGASQKISGSATYTKSGFASAGLVGSGPSTSLTQETGFGTVGGVGSGASASTTQRTGAGVVGLVGSGASASVTQETGFGTVGGVGSGVRSRDRARTGFATVGLVGSGADVDTAVETGFATAGGVGSGASASVNQETGFGTVGGVGSGASVFVSGAGTTYTKAGFAVAGLVGSGASASVSQENGAGIIGLVGSGSREWTRLKSGFATVGLVGSGADVDTAVETGFATVGGVGSGSATKATFNTYTKAGFATAGLVGAGPSESTTQETGAATVGLVGSGVSASIVQETGAGIVGTVGSGTATKTGGTTYTKAGFAAVGLVGSGADAFMAVERGSGVVGLVGSGGSASTYTKTGFATIGTVGSGGKVREHPRSGFATVGTTGSGARARVLTRTSYGEVGIVGTGGSSSVFVESGFGIVGASASGSNTFLPAITTTGMFDRPTPGGRMNGRLGSAAYDRPTPKVTA